MLNVNQVLEFNIISQNYEGLGVAKVEDMIVFVSEAITGEVVKAKITKVNKNYCVAKLLEVNKTSPKRVKPACPYFGLCGGCTLMHMDYASTLELKLNAFNETLKRIGHLDYEAKDIYGMENPVAYRNKIQMPCSKVVKNGKEKIAFGYFAKETHNVIAIDSCLNQSKNVTNVINFVKNVANELGISAYCENEHTGIIRHILVRENYKQELMVVLIVNDDNIPNEDKLVSKITSKFNSVVSIVKNINKTHNNVILGDKSVTLFGEDKIIDEILGIKFAISHKSFFQVNRTQTNKLYSIVLDFLGEAKNQNIIDGYCGVGSISLCLAKKAKHVYGIEVVEEAIVDAKNNALMNNINNVSFYADKVENKINELLEEKIDCVVIDPPRKGVEKSVIDAIIAAKIDKIIYVSCNPATLARDLGLLSEKYNIKDIKLVDMFCYTDGVESVTKLELKK